MHDYLYGQIQAMIAQSTREFTARMESMDVRPRSGGSMEGVNLREPVREQGQADNPTRG